MASVMAPLALAPFMNGIISLYLDFDTACGIPHLQLFNNGRCSIVRICVQGEIGNLIDEFGVVAVESLLGLNRIICLPCRSL